MFGYSYLGSCTKTWSTWEDEVDKTWAVVSKRDWKKNPETGVVDA